MNPDPKAQITWGLGACIVAVLVVLLLAFVHDPFFRYHTFSTALDDVEGVQSGTKVFFRGAEVGEVSSVDLDPATRTFTVDLDVLKKLHPTACTYVSVASANPFTAPTINLVAIEGTQRAASAQCTQAMADANCDPVGLLPHDGNTPIVGCRRAPDLMQTAAQAVKEAANVARTANEMAKRLQTMLQGSGDGKGADMASIAKNATSTLAALNSLSVQLDRSFTPGRGDIALTLANVRKVSGRAAKIDIDSANGILRETKALLAKNQESIAALTAQAAGTATQAHVMLEGASASLVETSANLDRVTKNLDTLSQRIAADPTFVIRGQHYVDPPAPGANK